MSIHLWSVLGRSSLVLYTALIKGEKKNEDETEALRNNVLSEVWDHSRWLRLADRVKGTVLRVALRERWRECREIRRRNGVRLALTDEEAEGMLQFDSSNSVCSYVVLYVHSARHPDNTNNNHQPKQLQGALYIQHFSSRSPLSSFLVVWNAQQPLPVLNPGPHLLI